MLMHLLSLPSIPMSWLTPRSKMVSAIVERIHKSPIPAVIHLDHSSTFDQIMLAIAIGTSHGLYPTNMKPKLMSSEQEMLLSETKM